MFPCVSLLSVVWCELNKSAALIEGVSDSRSEMEKNLFEILTKITEFHDFGTKFELDRIFSFFFHIEGGCNAPTSPKPSFWPLSQKWPFCPKLSYLIFGEFYPFLAP